MYLGHVSMMAGLEAWTLELESVLRRYQCDGGSWSLDLELESVPGQYTT